MRHEVAPVTRFHDEYIADPQHIDGDTVKQHATASREQDPEAIIEMAIPSSSRSSSEITIATVSEVDSKLGGKASLVPITTPFFHFDVAAAVRAAESGVVRTHRSYNTFAEKD